MTMEDFQLFNWDTEELFRAYETYVDDNYKESEEYKAVIFGIESNIPISHLTNKWYTMYPNSGKVSIKGHGKVNLQWFLWELKERENIMRKYLLDAMQTKSIIEARVGGIN